MTMGTNGQSKRRTLTRSTKRDIVIYVLGSVAFALVFVMALPTADAWYLTLGLCLTAIMSVVWAAKAILALRRDDYVVVNE